MYSKEQADKIRQTHAKARFKRVHSNFVNDMEDYDDTKEYTYDASSKIFYLDDGKLYDGLGGRKMCVVEIHDERTPGIRISTAVGYGLYVKGVMVCSDTNLARLKETGLKHVGEDDK